MIAAKEELLSRDDLYIVHITGPKELERVEAALALSEEEQKRWKVLGYQDRMGETLAAADCIVSRAGATSLAEISALAIPALLVPFPYATEDHQTKNARSYVEAGCADWIADAELSSDLFAEKLARLLDDEQLRRQMHEAALRQPTVNAARSLADVVEESARG